MAQTGFTPISLYYTTTAAAVPTAGNLVAGELAINTQDGKLFYKDAAGVVQVIAGKGGAGVAGGSNTQVQYNSSGSLAGSANMTFSGTALTLANDASISGLTVGKGNSAVATNTAVGYVALTSNTTGSSNVALGWAASQLNTTGSSNAAIGDQALRFSTTGSNNTALGSLSLYGNTTASYNTAVGYQSGYTTTTGYQITAIGERALLLNTTGSLNTAVGSTAMYSNTTGNNNSALGQGALFSNTTASANTAVGYQAAYTNSTGTSVTAIGYQALQYSVLGANTAVGYQAGLNNTAGDNLFIGSSAGIVNTTGTRNSFIGTGTGKNGASYLTASDNTALGYTALFNIAGGSASNTALGSQALYNNTTASNNTAVGFQAGYSNTTGIQNTYIGYLAGKNATVGLDNCFIGAYVGNGATQTGSYNLIVGDFAGYYLTSGQGNTFVGSVGSNTGSGCGGLMTTGSKNTIIGSFSGNQGGLDIRTASNYIVLSDGDGNPRQVIDSSGNVGIGLTGPVSKLQIYQTLKPQLTLSDATLGQTYGGAIQGYGVAGQGGYLDLGTWDNSTFTRGIRLTEFCSTIQFSTGSSNTERMRIDSSGNLLVGTTSADPVSNSVNGVSISGSGFKLRTPTNTNTWGLDATSGNHIRFFTSGVTAAGIISSSGSTTTYGTSSDYRLKDNVLPMTGALSKIEALKPVIYDWKTGGTSQGFIAHELQAVVSECVVGEKDAVDEEGNPIYQVVDTSFLVATLTAAIQEQQAMIEELKAKVAALEAA